MLSCAACHESCESSCSDSEASSCDACKAGWTLSDGACTGTLLYNLASVVLRAYLLVSVLVFVQTLNVCVQMLMSAQQSAVAACVRQMNTVLTMSGHISVRVSLNHAFLLGFHGDRLMPLDTNL